MELIIWLWLAGHGLAEFWWYVVLSRRLVFMALCSTETDACGQGSDFNLLLQSTFVKLLGIVIISDHHCGQLQYHNNHVDHDHHRHHRCHIIPIVPYCHHRHHPHNHSHCHHQIIVLFLFITIFIIIPTLTIAAIMVIVIFISAYHHYHQRH